eukprot:gnl/Spiro4/13338_TR7097_c0_g1_i1.p1 gnl/Spiro4/13338_TR7097_c0_g1~~gnl/Spiro4/13338_TR7097_c0_g1_i1.p1  ORF type:complete len:356 (-),score=127.70 gnl/Spiro4/13338_TR7097_c0_g1_i1:114-1181(-)
MEDEFVVNDVDVGGDDADALSRDASGPVAGPDDVLVVYSREGCGLCEATRDFLNSQGIEFVVRDSDYGDDQQQMFAALQDAGITGSFMLPVVFLGQTYIGGYPEVRARYGVPQVESASPHGSPDKLGLSHTADEFALSSRSGAVDDNEPQLVMYGRRSCNLCQATLRHLCALRIPFALKELPDDDNDTAADDDDDDDDDDHESRDALKQQNAQELFARLRESGNVNCALPVVFLGSEFIGGFQDVVQRFPLDGEDGADSDVEAHTTHDNLGATVSGLVLNRSDQIEDRFIDDGDGASDSALRAEHQTPEHSSHAHELATDDADQLQLVGGEAEEQSGYVEEGAAGGDDATADAAY